MQTPRETPDGTSPAPDIDAAGVDLAQIREMLALTPLQRLERVEAFVEEALEIRERNAPRRLL